MAAEGRWGLQASGGMRRALSVAALLAFAASLAACGDMSRFAMAPAPQSSSSAAKPARLMMPQTPATEKEHDRILAFLWRRL